MIEVVVNSLDGVQVATVFTNPKGEHVIETDDSSVEEKIREVISRAENIGIPLRSNRHQRMEQGVKYERLARWLKPRDKDFLQALADDLIRHRLFAYTVETSRN